MFFAACGAAGAMSGLGKAEAMMRKFGWEPYDARRWLFVVVVVLYQTYLNFFVLHQKGHGSWQISGRIKETTHR